MGTDECRARVLQEMRRLKLPGLKRMLDAERRISEQRSAKRSRHDEFDHLRHDGMLEQRSQPQPVRPAQQKWKQQQQQLQQQQQQTSQPPQTSQPTQTSNARPPQSCLIV